MIMDNAMLPVNILLSSHRLSSIESMAQQKIKNHYCYVDGHLASFLAPTEAEKERLLYLGSRVVSLDHFYLTQRTKETSIGSPMGIIKGNKVRYTSCGTLRVTLRPN